jgi:hypothetical protein
MGKLLKCKIIAPERRFLNMKKCYFFLSLFTLSFLFFLCKKPDITPAYLLLSEKDFEDCIEDNRSKFNKEHGTDYNEKEYCTIRHHVFREVLVSLNGQELGYFTPPCRITLLPTFSGKEIIRLIPCARTPHTSLTTMQYRFLKPIERSFDMNKEGEYTFSNPIFEYVESVSFPILETFETSTSFLPRDTTDNNGVEIFYSEDLSKYIGKVSVVDSTNFFNVVTKYFKLTGSGVRHCWEMYYKSENGEMVTYLNYQNSSTGVTHQDMMVLPETNSWKKIYIDLTEVISWASGYADNVSVRLGISGLRKSETGVANFYFDHVKVITMSAPY